jgi:hypothetical protein
MPTLPGRTPHDRAWLALWTVFLGVMVLVPLLGALRGVEITANPDPESLCWIVLFASALVADGWGSMLAFREAQDSAGPRAVNRWDVCAMALAFGSSAALAMVLALTPSESPTAARVLEMTLASGALLSWFAIRAHHRTRLPASRRGWPLDPRGTPRVPQGMRVAFSPHAWIGFALIFGRVEESGSPALLAPLWLAMAAESAANARRASDAWSGRPLTAFGGADLLELLCGLAAIVLACAVSLIVINDTSNVDLGTLLLAVIVAIVSVFHVAKILSRWKRRTVA